MALQMRRCILEIFEGGETGAIIFSDRDCGGYEKCAVCALFSLL